MANLKSFIIVMALLVAPFAQGNPLPQYAINVDGTPQYPENFTHFDYANPDAPKGGTIRLSAPGTFDSLNPYVVKGTPAIGLAPLYGDLLHAALMMPSQDEIQSMYGYIAEKATLADDETWIIFHLNPKAKFSDDTPILAEDVVYTFNALIKDGSPFYRLYFKNVIKAEALDQRSVKFTFKDNKDRELPLILGSLPVLPKKYYSKVGLSSALMKVPVGSGPYRIKAFNPGKSITYERVKDWWAKDLPSQKGSYNFDIRHYDYYRDDQVSFEAFKSGAFDLRQVTKAEEWFKSYTFDAFKKGLVKKEEITHEVPMGFMGIGMNQRRDMFKDPKVRRAMILAFDFEWANKNLFFGSYKRSHSYFENSDLAARGPITPEEVAVLEPYRAQIPPEVFTSEYSLPVNDGSGNARKPLQEAALLLKEAGWTIQGKQLMGPNKQKLTVEIITQAATYERVLQGYARNLERLGIECLITILDTATYQKRMENYDYDMTIVAVGESNYPGNEQRDFWSTVSAKMPGGRNYMGVSDPVIDALVESIIVVPSRQNLVTQIHALDRVLLWGNYAVPGWYSNVFRLAYWDKFNRPKVTPKYGLGIEYWWAK